MCDSDVIIEYLPAFGDNYIWVLRKPEIQQVVIVDPGDASVVNEYLNKYKITLGAILVTHHHADHTAGIVELLSRFPDALVYGPGKETVHNKQISLSQGEQIRLIVPDVEFEVIDVPGHTAGHIAFYSAGFSLPILFCGDTLFSVGCGRLFEGSAQQMYDSLNKLAALPEETRLYCAHEYTANNIEFAMRVMPNNCDLAVLAKQVKALRGKGKPSLPSTIKQERLCNPFVRCDDPEVIHSVERYAGHSLSTPTEVFAYLRSWKDAF